MAREITTHKVNGVNDGITLVAADEPGCGGANHRYEVEFSPGSLRKGTLQPPERWVFGFQNGPISEAGTNGITHEILLAILIDRLEDFQSGPFKCEANELALLGCETAMKALKERTLERLSRGVEGTLKP